MYVCIPSSEKDRKEGTRKERADLEWLILRHFRENHPSSACRREREGEIIIDCA